MPEARAINTRFDKELGEDVILEQVDGKEPAVATTLKNAENILKSFLYIKKMYTGNLSSAKVLGVGNVSVADYEALTIPEETQDIRISNTSSSTSSFKINGGVYIMQPGEIVELPIAAPVANAVPAIAGDIVELKGDISYILYIAKVV